VCRTKSCGVLDQRPTTKRTGSLKTRSALSYTLLKYLSARAARLIPSFTAVRNSALRKINELVKRTRLLRVHACLIGYLKEQMPMFTGREKKQQKLLADMPTVGAPPPPLPQPPDRLGVR
jgi:hypothetical protein